MLRHLEEVLRKRSIAFEGNVKAATLSTFRIGGPCRYLIKPACENELLFAVTACRHFGLPYLLLGRGSNLLFDDAPMEVALISTKGLDGLCCCGNGMIADCGVPLARLAARAAHMGYGDLAFAAGIPGTVGGGVFMNAGAHGKSLGEMVRAVTVFFPDTRKITTINHQKLSFSYRKSDFQANNAVILRVELALSQEMTPHAVQAEMSALLAHRKATQPVELPSAGSVFLRSPHGVSMGKIIDDLGLKGRRCGGAAISEKHGGFIVNIGGATAADVRTLICEIQDIVEKEYGFRPVTEIRDCGEK